MIYHAFYSNGLSASNPNLSYITQYPDIEYIVSVEYGGNGYQKFTIVDLGGLVNSLKIGGFELRDIGYVTYNSVTKKYPVTLTICETRLGLVFQETIHVKFNDVAILPQNILPFLKVLDEHGSYKSYKQSLELGKLESQIHELTKQLDECRKGTGK